MPDIREDADSAARLGLRMVGPVKGFRGLDAFEALLDLAIRRLDELPGVEGVESSAGQPGVLRQERPTFGQQRVRRARR